MHGLLPLVPAGVFPGSPRPQGDEWAFSLYQPVLAVTTAKAVPEEDEAGSTAVTLSLMPSPGIPIPLGLPSG